MILIINFKKYKKGKNVLKLAKVIQKHKKNSIVALLPKDIEEISKKTKLKVYSQFVDVKTISKIKMRKGKGSLINHSDYRVSLKVIEDAVKESKKLKFDLVVCARNLNQVQRIKKFKPYAIAFEDPKLIGTGKSITTYNAKDVKKFVSILKKTKIIPLCGAGISSKEDVLAAKKFGCKGVLVSLVVARSKNPEKFLKEV